MSAHIAATVEDWLLTLSGQEIQEHLKSLELKESGRRLQDLDRLHQWLLGNYTAEDFLPDEKAADVVAKRKQLRETFLQTTPVEGNDEEHPGNETVDLLKTLLADGEVINNLNKTTAVTTTVTNNENTSVISPTTETRANSTEKDQTLETEMITLLDENDKPFQIPKNFAQFMVSVTQRINTLQAVIENTSNTAGQQERTQTRVGFQDTYTLHYNPNIPGSTPHPTKQRTQLNPLAQSWEGGAQHKEGHPSEANTGALHSEFSTRSSFAIRDAGQTVRKWNLKFSGDKKQSVEVFLTRLEECRRLSSITETEMLASLSELFTDTALTWYRNEKDKWHTYADFITAARRWYGTSRRFQQRLLFEANNRFQGKDEPVRDFITNLLGIMRRIEPAPPLSAQLDLLHQNLLPQIQKQIRRAELDRVETLLDLATEVEESLAAEKLYRAPPSPETTLLPELGYRPPKEARIEEVQVAAVSNSHSTKSKEDLMADVAKLLQEQLAELKRSLSPNNNNNQRNRNQQGNNNRRDSNSEKSANEESGNNTGGRRYNRGRQPRREIDFTKPLQCADCGRLGFSKRWCPDCKAKNEQKSE